MSQYDDLLNLTGKTAIITGGGSGIGLEMCHLFARRGAYVVAVDISQAAANHTADTCPPSPMGGKCVGMSCDVVDQKAVDAVFAATAKDGRRIDILVNNAGIGHVGTVEETEDDDFDRVVAVNMKGVFHCAKAAVRHMKSDKKGGVILNTGSTASVSPIKDRFIYAATKGAVLTMTTSLASDHVLDGIRCNCICPGRVHTPFVDGFLAKSYSGKEKEQFQVLSEYMPMGRMAKPLEMAKLALYLCSEDSAFATGQSFVLDGGIGGIDHPKVYGIGNSHLTPPYSLSDGTVPKAKL